MTGRRHHGWKPSRPTPTLEQAIRAGAISPDTTAEQWAQMSPGYRRAIIRNLERNKQCRH